jgi:multidrug efflux pump subunit AcrB
VDSLARFVIGHVRFSALLITSVLVAGASLFQTQPRQEDPEVTLRSAQVVTRAPGLAPERIEQLVTRPIEDAIKEIPEIDEIKSVSATGLSIVTPEVDPRFTDMGPIWAKLRNKIDDIAPRLPNGVETPVVNDDYGRVAVVTLALTGTEFSLAELHDIARDLRDEIATLPLVARVDLYGAQPERIWLEFDPEFLAQFQLDPAEIASALQSQNVVLPGGTINAAGENVVVEPSGDFRSVEEIRNLPIATDEGGLLYLRDIADVRRAFVDPPEAPALFNNTPAIVLGISMVEDSNVVALGRELTELLDSLRAELPLGTALDVAIFQPDLVQASVNGATVNLLQTMGVVLAVVMIFLGWRTGLIVGAMVPLTMLLTIVGMSASGIALHRISIAAIIVALGLLVDNGIVVAEDIRRRLDAGVDRLEAALGTPRTLAVPLLTSSLTTVLAFLPLMLINDSTGEFLRSLGQVLAIALLGSWLLAISVTPALCYWFLPGNGAGARSSEGALDSRPYRAYRRLIEGILRHRVSFVVVMFALLVAAGHVFQYVKQRSLGPSARNQFTVYLDLPAQAHISQTIEATRTMAAYLGDREANPEVTDVLAYIGGGGPRFFVSLAPNDPQPNKAFLVVNTRTADQVPELMRRVDDFIIDELPEATGRADLLFLGPAALGTVELRVRGPEIGVLRRIAADVGSVFLEIGGVTGIRNDWENAVVKFRVEVDQERARRSRVTSQEVANALSAIFDGATVTDYREGDKVIPVVIRAQAERRDSLDRLRSTEIFSAGLGAPVPLLQIADIEGAIEPSRIRNTALQPEARNHRRRPASRHDLARALRQHGTRAFGDRRASRI